MSNEIESGTTDLPHWEDSPDGKDYTRTGLWAQLKEVNAKIEQLEAEKEKIKQAGNHYPECKFWEWEWKYSWDKTDCTCPLD